MSRTTTDALRSVKKYATEFLPDDYDVRLSVDQGNWDRPSALVDVITPQTIQGGPKTFQVTQAFTLYLWPSRDEDDTDASRLAAYRAEEAVVQAIQVGGQLGGRPRRIPLWDYDDVDLSEPVPEDREDGYLRVVDFGTEVRRDPDDDTAWTVVATVRVTWTRLGEGKEELEGPTVTSVPVGPYYSDVTGDILLS